VSGVVGGGFALMKGGKVVAGGGGKYGEGGEGVIFGSSSVERAHNLLNGVWPLVAMWKPRSQSQSGCCSYETKGFLSREKSSLISRGSCVRGVFARGKGVI
jgi:hypothetical protein